LWGHQCHVAVMLKLGCDWLTLSRRHVGNHFHSRSFWACRGQPNQPVPVCSSRQNQPESSVQLLLVVQQVTRLSTL
jgi:hypothetical protein